MLRMPPRSHCLRLEGSGSLSNSSALVIDGVRPAFTGGNAVTAGTKTLVLSLCVKLRILAVATPPDASDFSVSE